MNKSMSIYLDGIRLFAAIMVFAYHAAYSQLDGDWIEIFRNFGHDAVIIFFILSGYVISYVAHAKEHNISDFSIGRLSRLYSVTLAALIVTFIVDLIGSNIDPELYTGWRYQPDIPIIRFIANLVFANELWFYSIRAFSNGPFWSLGYEFWYYVLFGIYFYINNTYKWWWLLFAALICGPKILLLFPIWVLGHLTYKFNAKHKISCDKGWLLFLLPIITYFIYKYFAIDIYLRQMTEYALGGYFDVKGTLNHSRQFVGDYFLATLIAINFIGFNAISSEMHRIISKYGRIIKIGASYTFSIYLLHYPLQYFYYSLLKSNVLMIIFTAMTIIVIARYTEHKKYFYKVQIIRIYSYFEEKFK